MYPLVKMSRIQNSELDFQNQFRQLDGRPFAITFGGGNSARIIFWEIEINDVLKMII